MNNIRNYTITLAVSLAFTSGAMASDMSNNEYRICKDRIAAEYQSDKADCAIFSDTPDGLCADEAKGKEKSARTELDDNYRLILKAHYQADIAKATAEFTAAQANCDAEKNGSAKATCVKEAKGVQAASKADAKIHRMLPDDRDTWGKKSAAPTGGETTPAQACAADLQAIIAAFHANFMLHTGTTPHL